MTPKFKYLFRVQHRKTRDYYEATQNLSRNTNIEIVFQ